MEYDLSKLHESLKVPEEAELYQLTLSAWGVAAIIAALECLLLHDDQMRMDQRTAVRAMMDQMREQLKARLDD